MHFGFEIREGLKKTLAKRWISGGTKYNLIFILENRLVCFWKKSWKQVWGCVCVCMFVCAHMCRYRGCSGGVLKMHMPNVDYLYPEDNVVTNENEKESNRILRAQTLCVVKQSTYTNTWSNPACAATEGSVAVEKIRAAERNVSGTSRRMGRSVEMRHGEGSEQAVLLGAKNVFMQKCCG